MGAGCARIKKSELSNQNQIINLEKTISEPNKKNESFQITYTDFIRRKTGMILDDYKIKSTPLGKGPSKYFTITIFLKTFFIFLKEHLEKFGKLRIK